METAKEMVAETKRKQKVTPGWGELIKVARKSWNSVNRMLSIIITSGMREKLVWYTQEIQIIGQITMLWEKVRYQERNRDSMMEILGRYRRRGRQQRNWNSDRNWGLCWPHHNLSLPLVHTAKYWMQLYLRSVTTIITQQYPLNKQCQRYCYCVWI